MKLSNKKYLLITILISAIMFSGCSYIRFTTFNGDDKETESSDDDKVSSNQDNEKNDNNDKENIANKDQDTKDQDTKKPTENKDNDSSSAKPTATPVQIQPIANKELMIYAINSNSSNIEAVVAMVPNDEDITAQLIVDKVIEAMADQSIIVGIDSVITKDDTIIVNFNSDKAPLKNVGSGTEEVILNAIAQSLIDNLDDFNKVIYRVEDKPYTSGHIEMELNEVYLER